MVWLKLKEGLWDCHYLHLSIILLCIYVFCLLIFITPLANVSSIVTVIMTGMQWALLSYNTICARARVCVYVRARACGRGQDRLALKYAGDSLLTLFRSALHTAPFVSSTTKWSKYSWRNKLRQAQQKKKTKQKKQRRIINIYLFILSFFPLLQVLPIMRIWSVVLLLLHALGKHVE